MLGRVVAVMATMATMAAEAVAAQDEEVPPEVIAECNATVDGYDEMPDCLREGTIGFRMLETAAREGIYGALGTEVASACAVTNETYYTQWICLESAAKKAVDIRGMIGEAQMTDRCYRGLSDPDTLARLEEAETELRRQVAEDDPWLGIMTSYRAFEGCGGATDDVDKAAPVDPASGEEQEDDHDRAHEDDGGGYTPEACRAYQEVEDVLRDRDAETLRASFEALRGLPEDARLDALTRHGLSRATVGTLREELEGEAGLGSAILIMGFLRRTHPTLFEDVVAASGDATGPVADAMAAGVFDLLMNGVVESYRTACPRG